LTFFYRQMPILIERGYVSTWPAAAVQAQAGQAGDVPEGLAALSAYLIANAVEGAEFRYSADAPPLRELAPSACCTTMTRQPTRSSVRASAATRSCLPRCSTCRRRAPNSGPMRPPLRVGQRASVRA
jgi:hypothetical protein